MLALPSAPRGLRPVEAEAATWEVAALRKGPLAPAQGWAGCQAKLPSAGIATELMIGVVTGLIALGGRGAHRHLRSKLGQGSRKKGMDLTPQQVFDAIDVDGNGTIDRLELKRAIRLLQAQFGTEVDDASLDAFFFEHARVLVADWRRSTCEWLLDSILRSACDVWEEHCQPAGLQHTYHMFVLLEERLHLNLHRTLDAKIAETAVTREEFLSAVRGSCMEEVNKIVADVIRQVLAEKCEWMSMTDINAADKFLFREHELKITPNLYRLCMRMYGKIRLEQWKDGAGELLQSLGQVSKALWVIKGNADPEMGATLKNGIPKTPAFDFGMWEKAQSPDRWWKSLSVLFRKRAVIGRIWPPFFACVSFAVFTAIYDRFLSAAFSLPLLTLPGELFSLTAGPLGLLLVFRTNSSYARYVEARAIWGDTSNRCRDLARQATWIKDVGRRATVLRLLSAFAVLLKCHVRPASRHDSAAEAGKYLSATEIQRMNAVGMPSPIHVLNRLAWIIESEGMQELKHIEMSRNISELIANVGRCERLISTPIPLSFSRLSTRFLIVWLFLLPLYLYRSFGSSVILGEAFVAFFLLETEDVGHHIEEPFQVLPLDRISGRICHHIEQVKSMESVEQRS